MRPVSQFALEFHAPFRDQIVSGIIGLIQPVRRLAEMFRACMFRVLKRAPGNFNFRVSRASGKLFDGVAIIVPSREIHFREKTFVTQNLIHQADALEEFVPIKSGHQPHARNYVAHGNGHGRLILVLGADDFIRRGSLRVQPFIEPEQDRTYLRIQIAQTLNELHRECSLQRPLLKSTENDRRNRREIASAEQAVDEAVSLFARAPAANDAIRQLAEVLNEHDTEGDRQGPQLADGERLNPLVGIYKPPQKLRLKSAVGVRNECPGNAENAGIAFQMA